MRSERRLVVLRVLVVSVLATLLGRLWFLQVYAGAQYAQAAQDNRVREIVEPAPRGMIYDSSGRPLVQNRTVMVVSVNRSVLAGERDGGTAVLHRLAGVIGMSASEIARVSTPCGSRHRDGTLAKPPDCWNGSPYEPVPVKRYPTADPTQTGPPLRILEHREDFPGVTAELEPVRDYPEASTAAHLLGYLGPIRDDERKNPRYAGLTTAKVGRSGVEQVYDDALRGTAGVERLLVDKGGNVTGVRSTTPARAGDVLVLSLDTGLQKLAEQALERGIAKTRATPDLSRGGVNYQATTGAVVVLEAQTGRVAALASYPSYDPAVFTDGLTTQAFRNLTDPAKGAPLYNNATQGTFAPGSTFKIVSTSAAVAGGASLDGSYACPNEFFVGKQPFHNFEGESFGSIDLRTALIRSCDTVFYKLGYDQWLADGGTTNTGRAREVFPKTARAFGFGAPSGVDLPGEAAGLITDRAYKLANWKAMKSDYCAGAQRRPQGSYLQQLDAQSCTDGWRYNGGDAVNFAIGQGDVLVSPLQLARAYAALANGGQLYAPRVGKALISADGSRVTPIPPQPQGRLPVPPDVLGYIRSALVGVTQPGGTASGAYAGFPAGLVAGKTGTAEVNGQEPTAWFASFAPASNPRYVVVAMITQGGQGGQNAAPVTREIYDGIFGLDGHTMLPGLGPQGSLPTHLPRMRPDGTLVPPGSALSMAHAVQPLTPTIAGRAGIPAVALGGLQLPLRSDRPRGGIRTPGRT